MKKPVEKPSPEAKALSLFLMAYKTIDPLYKENAKYINKQWDLMKAKEISRSSYVKEVQRMIDFYGGYSAVVEKTVKYYIDKTGAWKLEGDDKYCQDAKAVADKLLNK